MRDTEIVDLYWERDESAIDQTRMRYEGYCDEISWRILENREDVQECLNKSTIVCISFADAFKKNGKRKICRPFASKRKKL